MKQLKVLIYLAISIAIFSSCKKQFLTLYPEGNLNEGNFYLSATDFQQAVVGAYAPLRDVANNAYFMDEMRSDNAYFDYNTKDRGNAATENLVTFLDDAANAITQNRYTADYNGISRTNVVLDRLAAITFPMTDSVKNPIIGEAKALRAHYYFDLVRTYGGVPLTVHEVKVSDDAFKGRATSEQVYTQIISDFTDALALLGNPTFSNVQTGRITKGMIATELGTVYMQRKEYAKAIPLFTSVTQMGYSLLPNFKDVLSPLMKNGNKELIFDVQFQSGTTLVSSNFIYRFTPITTNAYNIIGQYWWMECAY
jgi:tetratricopeptide (TPR) repeat protein